MDFSKQTAEAQPRPATCFAAMESVNQHAAKTVERISAIVDRLIGAYPEKVAGDAQLRGVPNGLLPAAMEHALSADMHLGRINELLTRLEQSLP